MSSIENRPEIGPRSIDLDRRMVMVVDAVDLSGVDIFVRLRVGNSNDEGYLDLGVQGAWYGPLLVLRDDVGNTYESLAVEPAGIPGSSVGTLRFRLPGPFDDEAESFSVELTTQRGLLTSPTIAVPEGGGAVRWLTEWETTTDLSTIDGSTTDDELDEVRVLGVADRGTHIDLSVRTPALMSHAGSLAEPPAVLTASDGTELLPFPPQAGTGRAGDTSVLRFPVPPSGVDALSLTLAGSELDVPSTSERKTDAEPRFADSPQLPDLIDMRLTHEPVLVNGADQE